MSPLLICLPRANRMDIDETLLLQLALHVLKPAPLVRPCQDKKRLALRRFSRKHDGGQIQILQPFGDSLCAIFTAESPDKEVGWLIRLLRRFLLLTEFLAGLLSAGLRCRIGRLLLRQFAPAVFDAGKHFGWRR